MFTTKMIAAIVGAFMAGGAVVGTITIMVHEPNTSEPPQWMQREQQDRNGRAAENLESMRQMYGVK